jgi:hypothetical protein
MAELVNEIKERLSQYVSGDLGKTEFHDWFALVLRDVHKSNDQEAETLAHLIEWQFFDTEHGKISIDALKTNLAYLSREQPKSNEVQFLDVPGCRRNSYVASGSTSIGANAQFASFC